MVTKSVEGLQSMLGWRACTVAVLTVRALIQVGNTACQMSHPARGLAWSSNVMYPQSLCNSHTLSVLELCPDQALVIHKYGQNPSP